MLLSLLQSLSTNILYFMLHLSQANSFPKPLSAKEEQEEFGMDEDGNSLDSYDTYVRCNWCDEIYTQDQCVFEANMGWLCDRCQSAITSRGEKLTVITNPTEEDIAKTLDEALTEDTENEHFGGL